VWWRDAYLNDIGIDLAFGLDVTFAIWVEAEEYSASESTFIRINGIRD